MIMSIKELMTNIKELIASMDSRIVLESYKEVRAQWVSQWADEDEVNMLLGLHKKLKGMGRLPRSEINIDVLAKNMSFDDFSRLMSKYGEGSLVAKGQKWESLLSNNKIAENDGWAVYAINSVEEAYLFNGLVKWRVSSDEPVEAAWRFYEAFENSSFAVIIRKVPKGDGLDIILAEHDFKKGKTTYWSKYNKPYRDLTGFNIPNFKVPTLDKKLEFREKLAKGEFDRFISELIDNGDGTYSSEGNVRIPDYLVENGRLRIRFKEVGGNFICSLNNLTTLEGAPQKVGGYFSCSHNNLSSLKGAPRHVGGDFICTLSNLTTLEGAPQYVGGNFRCFENPYLKSFGGIGKVGGKIYSDLS